MRLELSRQAESDLADIRDYSVEQFGLARAISYLDAIETAFRRIMTYPEMGGVHGKIEPPVRSLACHRHRIFYVIERDAIVVQRILHGAMDVDRHL